jgi:hypothetical protein
MSGWLPAGAGCGSDHTRILISEHLAGAIIMTGQKDRYSTTEKLWKLDDEQLTTPRHDEIVIDILTNGPSIFNKFKLPTNIKSYYEIFEYYESSHSEKEKNWAFNRRIASCATIPNHELYIKDDYGNTKHSFSFENTDALVEVSNGNINSIIPTPQILSEVPLSARNGFLVGFLDVLIKTPTVEETHFRIIDVGVGRYKYELCQHVSIPENLLGIEVKPNIVSFGQTLRQLNTYREYFKGKLMLCTDDTKFKEAFESQGIQVINTGDISKGDG